jgi:hypothetical protein
VISLSDSPVEIVKLQSVTLTREKQLALENDFRVYADATNYCIKNILRRAIATQTRAVDVLYDEVSEGFIFKRKSESSNPTPLAFGQRFRYDLITEYVKEPTLNPESARLEFAHIYAQQYTTDTVRTARVVIGRHRKLARAVISLQDKIPFFRFGTIILSGILADVSERAVNVLTLSGEQVSIPFDKRSRNRESAILQKLANERTKYGRTRLILNKEGFLDIDLRVREK